MTRDRWFEIKPLLEELLDLAPEGQRSFLENRCGDDLELRNELEDYLSIEDHELEFLEQPLIDLVAGRDPQQRVGERIGSFELTSELARGGMGVVYRAKRVEGGFEQDVAVKILKRGYDTGDFIRRARQERRILARLDHPHIARLLDGGATEDGLPYLVMELVEGDGLDLYCTEHTLDLEQRLQLFLQICKVVQLAHSNLIVHCDLKPSNILVTADGQPKLLDFGIAKVLHEDFETRTLALRLGTPGYASPEQLAGGNLSTATDIYALGGLLHLLIAGQTPRQPKDQNDRLTGPLEALDRRIAESPQQSPELAAWRASLRTAAGDLDAIVRKAMSWSPGSRYGSASELADDLRRHLERRPISAKPYSWWEDLKLTARRRRRELWIAAVILGLLGSAGMVGLRLWLGARLNATRAEESISAYLEILELVDPASDEPKAEAIRTALAKIERVKTLSDPLARALLSDRLGRWLLHNEYYEDAHPLLEEALELRRRHRPGEWAPIAASFNNLALCEKRMGNLERAVKYFAHSRELYDQHQHQESFDRGNYLNVLNNLARARETLGQLAQAETLDRQVLRGMIEHHGEDSRQATKSRANLGQLLVRMGHLVAAEPLLQRVLELRLRDLGAGAEKTVTARSHLATLWLNRGETGPSLEAYRSILSQRSKTYPAIHPKVATSQAALARALLERGRPADLEEAEQLCREALTTYRLRNLSNTENGLWTQRHLAAVRLARGDAREAEEIVRSVLEDETWTARGSWRGAELRSLLGACLLARGAYQEARPLLQESWNLITEIKGETSLDSRTALSRWQLWQAAAAGRSGGS